MPLLHERLRRHHGRPTPYIPPQMWQHTRRVVAQKGLQRKYHWWYSASLIIGDDTRYTFGRIGMKSNPLANGISHIASKCSLSRDFPFLLQQPPSLNGCWCYHPNADLISSIMATLLQTNSMDPLAKWRHLLTDPGKIICNVVTQLSPVPKGIPANISNWG
jgi:hypothetical protein